MKLLQDNVAVVTGASRGAGRAIALALGEAGATVYVTGRSRAGATTENLPGSIDDLAADPAVMARSGRVFQVGDLAAEYGFTDSDGRQVPPFERPTY